MMTVFLSLLLRSIPILWLFVSASALPSAIAYDAQTRDLSVPYDAPSSSAPAYDSASGLPASEMGQESVATKATFARFAKFLAAEGAAADAQYFISSGVRRSLSSQINGVNQIPAVIVREGQADVQATLNLNQLFSPKFEVPADNRLLNIVPPIRVPIEVQPLGIPGQPASIPLNQVRIVRPGG